nr:multicopper oxidase lpr1 [Quercus suber]
MVTREKILLFSLAVLGQLTVSFAVAEDRLLNLAKLKMFVDELPDMPKIHGFDMVSGVPKSKSLKIGMFKKKWKFHKDLPPTPVFAYGTSKHTATVPGPTFEALHGVDTYVTWRNHLPKKHILPWDPTIPTAIPEKGIPTVVHLHGGIDEPESDGNSIAWFTAKFKSRGATWTKKKYHYHNNQHPGNLWYHDHAMGLTRVNLLAGLIGAYIIRQPNVEAPLGLPYGNEFDRPLLVFDRAFRSDGSIYMNSTGNNPSIHPQWQPEYFGDAIIVNGKAWPRMTVRRRDPVNEANSKVLKFIINGHHELDTWRVPKKLMKYPGPDLSSVSHTRYIAMYEYTSDIDEPTHLYLNGKPYEAPVSETPKVGATEIWNIINLTEDNHPLHIHLGLFKTLDQTELVKVEEFKNCMTKINDAIKCQISKHARGKKIEVPAYEKGWKNVYKMKPGAVTKILVRFSYIHSNESYAFDATSEPGYVYHCHILDHEDNAMMRPLKFFK